MAQPQWITPSGSLGVIPEGAFYRVPVQATAGSDDVYFQLIAGALPPGIQITTQGFVEGTPKNMLSVQGVPTDVNRDVTSQFAIRAYTRRTVNGNLVVNRLADRTFTLTVTGQNVPEFITPPGRIGTYSDGTEISLQLQFTDNDPDDTVIVRVLSGELPPGTVLTRRGLITGIILPLVGPPGTAVPGYDSTPKDTYPNDFTTRSASKNFQFTAEITDGKDSNIRTFEIYVYAKNSETADTTSFTADNTFITADATPNRVPVLLNPQGSLGRIRADNYYAYKFDAIDFDGDAIEYSITVGQGIGFDDTLYDQSDAGFDRGTFGLPPGLQLDPTTGWLYGYIPNQGITENSYRFAIRVFKHEYPSIISDYYYFTITTIGNVDTEITWLTEPDLGIINNGAISTLAVEAVNTVGGRVLEYRLAPGSNSRLPQGLTLQSSGHITGRVSFNTFALDNGATTFDKATTTFDLQCTFTVNAFSPQTEQLGFSVGSITVTNGGYGFTGQPTITISAPPDTAGAIQATAGTAVIEGGVITKINLGNPGQGYLAIPTITITGGGGVAATALAVMEQTQVTNAVSVFREFTITINREFNQPYESLYIKAMPPRADRIILDQLLQNQNVIPDSSLYRPDDPNFGIASTVEYIHAYGLTAATTESYVSALDLNHYWKNLILGEIKTAQARDVSGQVIYEVIYSEVIDNLVNSQGQSVSKSVTLPYPVTMEDDTVITTVYPNSLINMRTQVIDTVGQVSPLLPLWMTSKQSDGRVLGFVPAWIIAYVKPGASGKIRYNIEQQMDTSLNLVDFKVDRYEIDRSQTHNWNSDTGNWIPTPPEATTFDHATCVFDGGSVSFNAPADRWTNTDEYDKYLVFPKTNILG
jgi:hypothetical protein